jgi:hypothetical protein
MNLRGLRFFAVDFPSQSERGKKGKKTLAFISASAYHPRRSQSANSTTR